MMKGVLDSAAYSLELETEQAVLTEPQTFFQLINPSDSATVRVLYPAYVFEME
jgi:hypothetical protein